MADQPDWAGAQAEHEAAIAAGGGGEAYQGLAVALFWQNEVDEAIGAMEHAFALFRREAALGRAAWAALWIAGQYARHKGNPTVAAGWIAKCERLLARAKPSAETGRVILVRALATNDPTEIVNAAERAMEIARRFEDADYEALALAYSGLAMLSLRRLEEGRARLDEAMAAVTSGEVRSPEAVGQIYCALLAGCERTVDFQRAEQWREVAQPFLDAYDHVGLTGTCRATYAGVLAATGDWPAAELELVHALQTFDAVARGMRADAVVRMADLRIRQGRLDEAARLMEGNEAHPDAQLPLAELELARGRPKVAAALLERRLHQLGATNLQAGPLLFRLIEAQITAGDATAARASAVALAQLAAVAGGDCLRGLASLANGLATAAEGGDPASDLDVALEHLERARMRWEAARARLAIAEAAATRNPELATREARAAMEAFNALGARPGADRARSLLRRFGVRTAGGPVKTGLSRREEEVARLVGLGFSNDQIALRLFLSPRTVEHHVTSILRKLPASGRTEVAVYAAKHLGADPG